MTIVAPKGPVTQPWTHGITFMQQTVLLTAVRGPDGIPKYGAIKMLLRWYRRCILISSLDGVALNNPYDPLHGGSFMGASYDVVMRGGRVAWPSDEFDSWPQKMWDVLTQYLKDLDGIPHHFQLHLMHAFEIVGYKHPDPRIRKWFFDAYLRLVHDMHLWPETEEQMDRRLGDSREQWLERADPATVV